MALRQCDNCSEMVDEARAFCPGCGHAFVTEEKRREVSKFDELDPTIQFGNTVYNQLLEDMGLNISNAPNPREKRVEFISPVNPEPIASLKTKGPATEHPTANESDNKIKTKEPRAGHLKSYILIGLVALVFLLPIALVSAILFVLDILSRLK